MIAGDDSDGDCHVVFTESALRAIAHYERMTRISTDVRGNEIFKFLRSMITTFEEDAKRWSLSQVSEPGQALRIPLQSE